MLQNDAGIIYIKGSDVSETPARISQAMYATISSLINIFA